MKAYQNVKIEILELKEDIVRTSGIITATDVNGFNRWDDIFHFGA